MSEIDYEKEMVGTVEVPERDKLDEAALTAWMAANVEGFEGPLTLAKFKGGQSNPTYRVDTPRASYVLRRQPFGKLLPSAHAVDREYRVMAALHPTGFPVPRPYGLCEDPEVIRSKFFVMSLADGRSLWNGALPNNTPGERREIYHAMIDTMADLHLKDPDAIGLSDFGKPTDYCARQIARWTKQYRLSETETIPEMDRLIEWLPETIPPQHESSVVHGDYRLDNMIFAADENRVIAVLDWELSTLGDPVADFAYLMLNWYNPTDGRAGLLGLDLEALGIPTVHEAVERYVARTGYPVPPMDWYFAYNLFRLAGIMQGIKKRVIDGTASSAHAKQMSERVKPLVERAYQFAQAAGLQS
ncbi:phosphotransferase family protein [Pelagerythrobacter rhizovicinus]|uniref:Phosphotransferase family protein n=1 Tax=Pelagerythrobacter rhizovicinus TaxID=2268576 RepID=A0A4V1QW88_9SPHN|nr:phosphotransferase family protein [Pelagerythrobacter rhizovicinus]RXZ65306.1 phosphotransferase family protein [Pelagerythrobacter rhizovicinus]